MYPPIADLLSKCCHDFESYQFAFKREESGRPFL